MNPHASCKFEPEEKAIFYRIQEAVDKLPDDLDKGALGFDEKGKIVILSCHILVRAVAEVFGLRYRDGNFCDNYNHSWLITRCDHIIDVYPIGVLGAGVMMVDGDCFNPSPYDQLYVEGKVSIISQCTFSTQWFCDAVSKVATMLRKLDNQANPPSP